jgi:hypothetical protein
MRARTYSGVRRLDTFEERFDYLSLRGEVGASTFGFDRHINQAFYRSREWRMARDRVISRDRGCDLGLEGYEIHDMVLVHHIQPMTVEDIEGGNPLIFDEDNLICVTHTTHNAIHYGDRSLIPAPYVERSPGDTKLW